LYTVTQRAKDFPFNAALLAELGQALYARPHNTHVS
jgi:hypothetical protein